MGRADLIGNGNKHLVPSWQPGGKHRNQKKFVQKEKFTPAKTRFTK